MKERNIPMDRLYTSISTSNWLLKHNITLVGTLVSNCVGLPDEVKDASQQDEFESTIHWEQEHGNLALCAYTTKSKQKEKRMSFYYQQCDHFLVLHLMTENVNQPS